MVLESFFGREMVDFVNKAAIGIDIFEYYFTLACFVICIILERSPHISPPPVIIVPTLHHHFNRRHSSIHRMMSPLTLAVFTCRDATPILIISTAGFQSVD